MGAFYGGHSSIGSERLNVNQEVTSSILVARPNFAMLRCRLTGKTVAFEAAYQGSSPCIVTNKTKGEVVMILKTRPKRITAHRLINLEQEIKPLLNKAMRGAASSHEAARIETIFSLCRQANKLEQYRHWHAQVKANLGAEISA